MTEAVPPNFIAIARQRLDTEWTGSQEQAVETTPDPSLPEEVVAAVSRCVGSKTKSYRYVLPTQLLAKLVDAELDCRSVQASSGLDKSFDARSLGHSVIVDFDRANHNVLGGSPSPYLSNPLRIPAITSAYRQQQKDKAGFDDLMRVLDYAQQNPDKVAVLYKAVMLAIRERLAEVVIIYPVPNRVSLTQALALPPFLQSCLVLFGEGGRTELLRGIGNELDERRADLRHRRTWAALLGGL